MNRRHGLLVVLGGTLVIWCSPIVAFAQERPVVAPRVQGGPPHVPPPPVATPTQVLPTFGALDAGGMPRCLHELRAGGYSEGHLVLANTPYYVWWAPKRAGQEYLRAAWNRLGPWTFAGGGRYLFRGGAVTSNPRPTSTDISPGLASLHFENSPLEPVWSIVNPLPPGCGGPDGGPGGPPPPSPSIDTRTQRTLTVRTQLRPVGWPKGDALWFAPGAYWVDAFDGGVQSGLLGQAANLRIWNSNGPVGFGPGFIRFERAGGVKEGTLPADTSLCVVNTASNSKLSLTFRGNTTVEFGYDGCVMKGTLAQEATLKSWDGGPKTYPAGTLVDFNGAGLITKAVLPPSGPTRLDGLYNGTCTIVGLDTFSFSFRASNGAFSGSQDQGLYSLQWQGNYDQNGTIQNGLMTGWVDVVEGGQKVRWTVRGPINGTLAAAALTITTADGKRTWTGNCTGAGVPGGTAPAGPGGGPAAGPGEWIQTDNWTSKWSNWDFCDIAARVEGGAVSATTESSNKCDSANARFRHSWTALPKTLQPAQPLELQLSVEDAGSAWTKGQGRGYTAVFVGSYDTRRADLPQDVRMKGIMDFACEEKDSGPLFAGDPLGYVASRIADWGYKDRSSLRPIQAAMAGAAFLCRGGGKLANRVVSIPVPTFDRGDTFLVIVVGGHGVRVTGSGSLQDTTNTIGAHHTLYVEYSRKK